MLFTCLFPQQQCSNNFPMCLPRLFFHVWLGQTILTHCTETPCRANCLRSLHSRCQKTYCRLFLFTTYMEKSYLCLLHLKPEPKCIWFCLLLGQLLWLWNCHISNHPSTLLNLQADGEKSVLRKDFVLSPMYNLTTGLLFHRISEQSMTHRWHITLFFSYFPGFSLHAWLHTVNGKNSCSSSQWWNFMILSFTIEFKTYFDPWQIF